MTEKANTFTRASVVWALAGELSQGASAETLERLVSSFLEDQRVLVLAPALASAYVGVERYTTRSLLAVEQSAVELARERGGRVGCFAST